VAVRSCTPQNQRYVVARIDTQSGVSATASVSSPRVLRATVAEISPLTQSVVLSSKPQSSNTLGFGRVSVARLRRSALPVGQPVTAVRLLTPSTDRLSERERERFNTGFEKLDLTHALVDRSWLPNQLMETLLGHGPSTLHRRPSLGRHWRLPSRNTRTTFHTSASKPAV
jgi:hypothetical protein